MHLEKTLHFIDNAIEVTGLEPRGRLVGVAVHRVALPDHLMPGGLDLLHDRWQQIADLVVAHPAHQRQPARLIVRVGALDVLHGQFRGHVGAQLDPDRISNHLGKRDVRAIDLSGPLADPHGVCGQVKQLWFTVFTVGQPQHGALVVEHQSFMAGIDFGGL